MKGTFNSYGTTSDKVEGSVPVWLGVVKPYPVGGRLVAINQEGILEGVLRAGTPCHYDFVNKTVRTLEVGEESEANSYLYNDIKPMVDNTSGRDWTCTASVVMAHKDGLLFSRVPDAEGYDLEVLKKAVPNVVLIEEPISED